MKPSPPTGLSANMFSFNILKGWHQVTYRKNFENGEHEPKVASGEAGILVISCSRRESSLLCTWPPGGRKGEYTSIERSLRL